MDRCLPILVLSLASGGLLARADASLPEAVAPVAVAPEEAPTLPPPRSVTPLTLNEVLLSVDRHHPTIAAAEQERNIAQAQLLSAQGIFDLNLTTAGNINQGTYNNQTLNMGFQQATPYQGISLFGGYRLGYNTFPTYNLNLITAQGGEFQAGMMVPLFRDRAIDSRRAALQTGAINRRLAEPSILGQRLDMARGGATAFWSWVAAGWRYHIAEDLLLLAKNRDAQFAEMVRLGKIAPIDREDNYRTIIDRQSRLTAALKLLQQATISLSLYFRDDDGHPILVDLSRLPDFPDLPALPEVSEQQADLERALRQRPEINRLRLLRERAQVDLRLAQNQQLPGVNLTVGGAQDVGGGTSPLSGINGLNRAAYQAGVLFDMPLQRRQARGKEQAARATLMQLTGQEQMARDRVVSELRDALARLQQSLELHRLAQNNIQLTRKLADAEMSRYLVGQGNLLLVNMRELMAAEARATDVDALLDYFRSHIDYLIAQGMDLTRLSAPRQPDH
jgi:cobalt-zinc-cadmium efflux system outer membrane protein